jgi:hypothetical protein
MRVLGRAASGCISELASFCLEVVNEAKDEMS